MNEKCISQLIVESQFVDVFDDNADESFYGYITNQSSELLQLEHFDEEGRFDGILILEKEDISRIRWGGNAREITENLISERTDIEDLILSDMKSAVLSLYEQFGHVCLTMGMYGTDTMFIGEIHKHQDDSLILHEYGTRSNFDRSYLLLRWDDISRVQAGGVYEKNLHELYNKSQPAAPHLR